jgi:hypothetical protein
MGRQWEWQQSSTIAVPGEVDGVRPVFDSGDPPSRGRRFRLARLILDRVGSPRQMVRHVAIKQAGDGWAVCLTSSIM